MIDPDGIQIQKMNLSNIISINMEEIPECDIECYCLDDEKEYEHFVRDVESQVRRSYEYKHMINYLRENMNMNQCAFLKGVNNTESFDIKIEIHHYPFSLRDIVDIVIRKRQYYHESITVQMVSKEVMMLHYKLMVGLIPLSQTVHELAHSSRLFIPIDKVMGRYDLFIQYYKPFCEPEQLDTLERIEKYSKEQQNTILDTNIIEQNKVSYDIKDSTYLLPPSETIGIAMKNQLELIKNNNYLLPSVDNAKYIEQKKDIVCPVIFNESLKRKPEEI